MPVAPFARDRPHTQRLHHQKAIRPPREVARFRALWAEGSNKWRRSLEHMLMQGKQRMSASSTEAEQHRPPRIAGWRRLRQRAIVPRIEFQYEREERRHLHEFHCSRKHPEKGRSPQHNRTRMPRLVVRLQRPGVWRKIRTAHKSSHKGLTTSSAHLRMPIYATRRVGQPPGCHG